MNINIVANNLLLKKIRTIDTFSLDLGKSVFDKKAEKIEFGDSFIEKYINENNKFIHKFGYIGSIKFYSDITLPMDKILIHVDEKVYDIDYEDRGISMKSYLSDIIKKIVEHSIEHDRELEDVEEIKPNLWVADDEKNRNKTYEVNQKLDRETYIQELIKKRNNG
jgi:hypothetical protein